MAKGKENGDIEIPEPINMRKGNNMMKQNHPPTNLGEKQTISIGSGVQKVSKFEPAAIPIEIPSHGQLYKNLTPDEEVQKGIIRIRQITMTEEKILTTERLVQSGKALDMILENCIKSNVNPSDLLSSDRFYILFYLRGMSFGLDYDFNVRCYHCGHDFIQEVKIDKLPIKEWEQPVEEPFEIILPMSGYKVVAHFMRGHEENRVLQSSKEMKSFNEPDSIASDSLTYLIDKILTPDGEELNKYDKEDFIAHMIAADIDEVRTSIDERDCGIQPLKKIICPKCNRELEFNVPLGRNFFRSRKHR
jgi:hypothetical protein